MIMVLDIESLYKEIKECDEVIERYEKLKKEYPKKQRLYDILRYYYVKRDVLKDALFKETISDKNDK